MPNLQDESVEFKIHIRSDPNHVFDGIATAEGLNKWFTSGTDLDPTPGGAISFRWTNWGVDKFTGEYRGRVIEWRRPNRFAFDWQTDSGTSMTRVEINMTPSTEGTIVEVRDSGFEDSPAGLRDMLSCATGWGQALTLLKVYLEYGIRI